MDSGHQCRSNVKIICRWWVLRENYYGNKTLTSWYMNLLANKHAKYYYIVWVSDMVGKTGNVFVFLSLWYYKRFRIAYLPFSLDVAECVISCDEHEYYGDIMRQWFLLKTWGPRKIKAPKSLIWRWLHHLMLMYNNVKPCQWLQDISWHWIFLLCFQIDFCPRFVSFSFFWSFTLWFLFHFNRVQIFLTCRFDF